MFVVPIQLLASFCLPPMSSVVLYGLVRGPPGETSPFSVGSAGPVPCVLCGGGGLLPFTASAIGFAFLVYAAAAPTVVLLIGCPMEDAVLRGVRFHPVSVKFLPADFSGLRAVCPVPLAVPVALSGSAPGVLAGGGVFPRTC
jgi:hypothetical protein